LTTHFLDLRRKRGIWTGLAATKNATKLGLARPFFRAQYWRMPSSWAKSLFGTRQICATPRPPLASEICWYFEEPHECGIVGGMLQRIGIGAESVFAGAASQTNVA